MYQIRLISISALLIIVSLSFTGCGENSNSADSIESAAPSFLFVQNSESGTLEPINGEVEKLLLTLNNIFPDTVYFSDRPKRIAGQQPTPEIIDNFLFDLSTPPNAALQIRNEDGSIDVIALSLLNAEFNTDNQSLNYEVTILAEELNFFNDPNNNQIVTAEPIIGKGGLIPIDFGSTSLFIDNIASAPPTCTHLTDSEADNICFSPSTPMVECDGSLGFKCGGGDGEPNKCCYTYIEQFYCCALDPSAG